jgi:hypothetical protein
MHRGHFAGRHGVQFDAEERQPVVQIGDVGELAAEPVQGLDDDHVEPARRGVHLHLLERRAQSARAAQRAVRVDPYDLPALELGVPPADLGLVLNRAVRSLGSEVGDALARR